MRAHCDIVVLEVGLGGELDSTNVIENPEVSVITNIGLDHMQVLGDTIEEIAHAKAGIIKPGCPCVVYRQQSSVEAVFSEVCQAKGSPLVLADFASLKPISAGLDGQRFDWKNMADLHLPLLGAHQLNNACTVLSTVETLRGRGWNIPESAIRAGLASVTWPGRFDLICKNPLFIVDGGHNPQCLEALEAAIKAYLPGRKLVFLNGCMADKDYSDMFRYLLPYAQEFVTVTPPNPRALTAEALSDYLRSLNVVATPCQTVAEGVLTAIDKAGPDGVVCACGSLYMIGDIVNTVNQYQERSSIQ